MFIYKQDSSGMIKVLSTRVQPYPSTGSFQLPGGRKARRKKADSTKSGAVGSWQKSGRSSLDLFLDPGSLTRAATQVVQLGATNITTTLDFDTSNAVAVSLEYTLNAFAIGHFANSE